MTGPRFPSASRRHAGPRRRPGLWLAIGFLALASLGPGCGRREAEADRLEHSHSDPRFSIRAHADGGARVTSGLQVEARDPWHLSLQYSSAAHLVAPNGDEVQMPVSEASEDRLAFLLVDSSGAPAARRGRVRFGICSADRCQPITHEFELTRTTD